MKRFLNLAGIMIALLLAACSERTEPVRPIAEIKGKPISARTNSVVAEDRGIVPASPTNEVAVAPAGTNAPLAMVDGYYKVGFDKLSSFNYIMPDEVSATNQPPKDQFPAEVKALDQKPIALRGFMLPLKIDEGLVTEMLIMKDQSMCCFGTSPKITEWVSVKMAAKGVKPVMDQPVMLFGKLRVGEMRENGYLVGIYQLDGEKMEWQ